VRLEALVAEPPEDAVHEIFRALAALLLGHVVCPDADDNAWPPAVLDLRAGAR